VIVRKTAGGMSYTPNNNGSLQLGKRFFISQSIEKEHIMTVATSGCGRGSYFAYLIDQIIKRPALLNLPGYENHPSLPPRKKPISKCLIIDPCGRYFSRSKDNDDVFIELPGFLGQTDPFRKVFESELLKNTGHVYLGYIQEPFVDLSQGRTIKGPDGVSAKEQLLIHDLFPDLMATIWKSTISLMRNGAPLTHIFVDNAQWAMPFLEELLDEATKKEICVVFNTHDIYSTGAKYTFGIPEHILNKVGTVISFDGFDLLTTELLSKKMDVPIADFMGMQAGDRFVKVGDSKVHKLAGNLAAWHKLYQKQFRS
jgi:hypothetical protein